MAKDNQQHMTVDGLRSLSATYAKNAVECDSIGKFLRSQGANAFWQSGAADKFKSSMSKYQESLKLMHDDFVTLSDEVKRRAGVLEESQR